MVGILLVVGTLLVVDILLVLEGSQQLVVDSQLLGVGIQMQEVGILVLRLLVGSLVRRLEDSQVLWLVVEKTENI